MEYPICACGCGQEITRKPRPDRLNKFIHGHSRKGLVMSEDQKHKISISNTGKKRTIQNKKLLSKIHKENYRTGKRINPWKGKRNDKIIEGRRKWLQNFKPKPLNERPNGGRVKQGEGYIMIFDTRRRKYILEHRLIMEQHIGRDLYPEEDVHHINGDKTNNSIDNLMLFPSRSAHIKFHQVTKYHT